MRGENFVAEGVKMQISVSLISASQFQLAVKGHFIIEEMRNKALTTGPDLPVKPIGPGGPLIASCKPDPHRNKIRFFSGNIPFARLGLF